MTMERKPTARPALSTALILLTLAVSSPVLAVDVRQPDEGSRLRSDLTRAYVPCTAPNATVNGLPACSPAVTSPCGFIDGSLALTGADDFNPFILARFRTPFTSLLPPQCENHDDYVASIGARGSAEFEAGGDDSPCPSGSCTLADAVTTFDADISSFFVILGNRADLKDGNFELFGFSIADRDGLPMAAAGVGAGNLLNYAHGNPPAEHYVSNLTIPIAPCTSGDSCDLPPIASPCDFDSGEIEWSRDVTSAPQAHVTLRDVAGSSPVCTTGTYQLQATVRVTLKACGTLDAPELCTLADQTLTAPLHMKGRNLDDEVVLRPGDIFAAYLSTEILGVRIVDPTGTPVAATGLGGVERALTPRLGLKGDVLTVRTDIPNVFIDSVIDPASDPGVTLTVSGRNGIVYAVTIPAERWQLQPPIGSRWDYADRSGLLNGVRKARVKRIVKSGVTTAYAFELKAKGVDLSAADFPGVTVQIDVHRLAPALDDVVRAQSFRTCRGSAGNWKCT
jgi:hypothetical protein